MFILQKRSERTKEKFVKFFDYCLKMHYNDNVFKKKQCRGECYPC